MRPRQTFAAIDTGDGFAGGWEMAKLSGIELKRARLVPSSAFASPEEVLGSPELSRAQKIAILRALGVELPAGDARGQWRGRTGRSWIRYDGRCATSALGRPGHPLRGAGA